MKSLILALLAVWCAGAYDAARGTNFGACTLDERRLSSIESPGDAGGGASADSPGDAGSGASAK